MSKSRYLIVALLCLRPSVALAQPRPGAFSTVVTTDVSVTSICVGGNAINAPSTCLGGLQAGPTVINQAITLPSFTPAVTTNRLYNVGGNLFFNGLALATGGSVGPGTATFIPIFTGANSIANSLGSEAGTVHTLAATFLSTVFGANSFTAGGVGDESLTIRNTTAGVANRGIVLVGNDASATLGALAAHSSTFTTSGAAIANGVKLTGNGVGGLSLQAADATGIIHFFTGTGTVERGSITAAGLFNWTTFGVHTFTAGGTGANAIVVTNPTAGAGNNAAIAAVSDTVTLSLNSLSSTFTTAGANVQGGASISSNGIGGLSVAATHAAGAVRIYTGSGTLRATFDAAGNFNLGSTNVMDSPAVPTITSGFGAAPTIAGRNTAFRIVVTDASAPTSGVIAFNTTYTNAPACTATLGTNSASSTGVHLNVSTTTINLAFSAGLPAGTDIMVVCRGY